MVATNFEIRFTQSRINYFETVLKRGADDSLKTLIKAVIAKESNNNLSAESIARVMKESYTELGKNGGINSKAVVKVAEILTGKSKFEVYQYKDFKKDAAKVLKNYGFINAILKNIPSAGKDVLKDDATNKIFTAYASDTLKDDALKAANAYFKIVATTCGTGPFETIDLPEKDANSHHVQNCLAQANEIAYALLADANCGSDKLDCYRVKESCYYAIADRLYDLYNRGNVEQMMVDIKGEYPYEQAVPDLPEIKKEILEYEENECLRAKKKQIEEGLEKLLKANDLLNETDLDAMKYNNEILEKIVDKIEEKSRIELINNNQKKEIEDWLVYAKKQMEEKDREIELLKTELEKTKLTNDSEKLTEIESTVQQYHHEDL
jgi:hypothetical protein